MKFEGFIDSLIANDPFVWNKFFNDYGKKIVNYIKIKIQKEKRKVVDVEDVLQEVFKRLLKDGRKALRRFKEKHSEKAFKAWLFKVTNSVLIDLCGRCKKINRSVYVDGIFKDVDEDNFMSVIDVIPYSDNIDENLVSKQILEEVNKVLKVFPERWRLVYKLRFVKGFPYKDISKITGYKINTVASDLKRMVEKISERLKKKKLID